MYGSVRFRMSVLIEHQTRIAIRVCLLKERPHLLLIKLHVKILGKDIITHTLYPSLRLESITDGISLPSRNMTPSTAIRALPLM